MSRGRLWEDRYRGSDNNRGNYGDCNCHCSSLVRYYPLSALLGIFCLFREAANARAVLGESKKKERERERERDGKKWKGKKEENECR